MPDSLNVLEWTYLGNPVTAWLIAVAAFAGTIAIVLLARRYLFTRFEDHAARTATRVDDAIVEILRRTGFFLALVLAVAIAVHLLLVEPVILSRVRRVVLLALLVQAGLWGNGLFDVWIERYTRERITVDAGSVTTIRALLLLAKLLLWSVLLLLAMANVFDVNISALLTGLGIGGIAVALAVQNILGDLFASLSIVLDKPFVVGDFIIVDGLPGTVEDIGLKTTRVRALSGEQLIFSNTDLLKARIRNFKRMSERRIVFSVGIEYGTPVAKVEQVPQMIRDIITRTPNTRLDRSHFFSYGDSSLVIETAYFVLSPEYVTYMDIQQSINLEIARRFEALGINFAFPTRTVIVRQEQVAAAARTLLTDGVDAPGR